MRRCGLQTKVNLPGGWPVCLVLDEDRIDPAMRVSLPSNLGFGRRRVQVLVDDVENVSLATLDPDDDDGHVVGSGEILEGAVDRNDLAVEGVRELLVRLAGPRINSAVVADFAALDEIPFKRRRSLLILACKHQPAPPLLLDYLRSEAFRHQDVARLALNDSPRDGEGPGFVLLGHERNTNVG